MNIKIYSKECNLATSVSKLSSHNELCIYKYEGEIKHAHMYHFFESQNPRFSFYDYICSNLKGDIIESVSMSEKEINRFIYENNITTKEREVLSTGNNFKTETLSDENGFFEYSFKNGDLEAFMFKLSPDVINEYLNLI